VARLVISTFFQIQHPQRKSGIEVKHNLLDKPIIVRVFRHRNLLGQ